MQMDGPEDLKARVELLLGLNQLMNEYLGAAGDMRVVVVAEVENSHSASGRQLI
jgi:hypothetical protein